jgi:hypothetical protein
MAASHLSETWAKTPYVIRKALTGVTTPLAQGTHLVATVPAKTLVLHTHVEVTTAGTGTGTVTVGDTGSAARYMTAAAPTSAVYMTMNGAKYGYLAETAVNVTVATDTVNAALLVTLVVVDIA